MLSNIYCNCDIVADYGCNTALVNINVYILQKWKGKRIV